MFIKSCIFILQITNIFTYRHQKPLAERLWSEGCKKNSVALNDCNWCRCDNKQKYHCKARVCEEIDMFGHFKDAIQEINVGMEGHGSWRSLSTPCTPGVHYRRGDVLCLCDEDGHWPNPVCRDLFRVLHTVEGVYQNIVSNQTCSPSKLYLVGCNVCLCSSRGYLDAKLCTKKECQDDDPALSQNQPKSNFLSRIPHQEASEIYASCDPNYRYDLGCMSCFCIKNNRLLCNNCSESQLSSDTPKSVIGRRKIKKHKKYRMYKKHRKRKKRKKLEDDDSYGPCQGKGINEKFETGCNLCFCDKYARLFCTVRDCMPMSLEDNNVNLKLSSVDKEIVPPEVRDVVRPPIDDMCTPGTTYKKECNICICIEIEKVKVFDCSLNVCSKDKTAMELQHNDCVVGKVYKMDCQICYCYTIDKIKHQICQYNPECEGNNKGNTLLKGYCQPLQYFKKDCNTCRCLSDGKTAVCSTKTCAKRTSESLTVDVIPVQMMNSETCPKGYSYQLDCNLCFCLTNGNAICTTADCSDADEESAVVQMKNQQW